MTAARNAFLLLSALCLLATPAGADFQVGVAAAERGNHAAAYREWLGDARAGNLAAQFNLGVLFESGRGVRRDNSKALEWYRRAAEGGFAPAQHDLGVRCENGFGLPKDPVEAAKWYLLAAQQGYPPSQTNLGYLYKKGLGVPQDNVKAFAWYTKAAEQGDVMAQYNLGAMLAQGLGVAKDRTRAYMWLLLAAEKEFEPAESKRDDIEDVLGDVEIAEGERLAHAWREWHGN
jgi:hypothetical protein